MERRWGEKGKSDGSIQRREAEKYRSRAVQRTHGAHKFLMRAVLGQEISERERGLLSRTMRENRIRSDVGAEPSRSRARGSVVVSCGMAEVMQALRAYNFVPMEDLVTVGLLIDPFSLDL